MVSRLLLVGLACSSAIALPQNRLTRMRHFARGSHRAWRPAAQLDHRGADDLADDSPDNSHRAHRRGKTAAVEGAPRIDQVLDEIEKELEQHQISLKQHQISLHGTAELQPWRQSASHDGTTPAFQRRVDSVDVDAGCYVLQGEDETGDYPTWLLCSEPPETRDGELECEEDWLGIGRRGEFLCRIKYGI